VRSTQQWTTLDARCDLAHHGFQPLNMLRFLLTTLLCLAFPAMAQGLFLQTQHTESKRFAVFHDNERVGYLYLTAPGVQRPERDAIAYSRVPPVDREEWLAAVKAGGTPMPLKELASDTAILAATVQSEFSFKWSRDGDAVALLHNGVPIAFASSRE
jgi:hypothetical protein